MRSLSASCLLTLACVAPLYVVGLAPVIFVPGLGGSVLEASLHSKPPLRDCATEQDWFTLWFSEVQILYRYDCFMSNIELRLNASGQLADAEGVAVRGRDYGGLGGVNYANAGSSDIIPVPYLNTLTAALERVGYVAGKSLRAATYDFRKAGDPSFLKQEYARLTELIEETSHLNGGSAVHLLSHSLGCSFANHFLQQSHTAWKRQYIASSVFLSPPFAGTPVAMQGAVTGPVFPYVPQNIPALIAPAIRTFPCILWMFPSDDPLHSIWGDDVFFETKDGNYSYENTEALLRSLDATVLQTLWPSVELVRYSGFTPPGVPALILYANDSDTAYTIKTDHVSDMNGRIIRSVKGDGTVTLNSLRLWQTWIPQEDIQVHEYAMGAGVAAHTDIVKYPPAIADILAWVQQT